MITSAQTETLLPVVRYVTIGLKQVPTGLREAGAGAILVAQASSTISTRLRGHANAYNLIDIESGQITVAVREWQRSAWTTRWTKGAP